jgi:hypothetical protein
MYRKLISTFLVSLGIFFLLFQFLFQKFRDIDDRRDERRTAILIENTTDRFKEFLRLPLSVGIIGADYLSDKNLTNVNYDFLFKQVLFENKDILGINLIDLEGKIIKVIPEEKNQHTLGKITQNIKALRKSSEKGDLYWLSAPFDLFQGEKGFVIYAPIRNKGEVKGWIASVMSTKLFAEKFSARQFFKDYDLIVKDQESGNAYLASGIAPEDKSRVYESYSVLHGRPLIFESWRKDDAIPYPFSWEWSLILSVMLALLASYTVKLYYQKKKASSQLEDISTLLGLTAKEAINNLISEQTKKFPKDEDHISYLSNLVEQIDLLQTMSETGSGPLLETYTFLPLLKKPLDNLEPVIRRKDLHLIIKEDQLNSVKIHTNLCLFQNSVVANILAHCFVFAAPGSNIRIETAPDESKNYIIFHSEKLVENIDSPVAFDRRMDVAKKVLQIYEGELYMQRDLAQGMIIRIILPN